MSIKSKIHFHTCLPPLRNVVGATALNVVKRKIVLVRCSHMSRPVEKCQNPWKRECRNTNIEVYIIHEEQQLPICIGCWHRIADEDYEWRE